FAPVVQQVVAIGQACPSQRVIRIDVDGLLEVSNTLPQPFRGSFGPEKTPLQVQLVSSGRRLMVRLNPVLFLAGQADAQVVSYVLGKLPLEIADVGHALVVMLSPQLRTIADIHQFGLERDAVALPQDAPGEYGFDAELTPDCAHIVLLAIAGNCGPRHHLYGI